MSDKRESFIKGALILTLAGFIVKFLGAIYRIPLARIIGDEGMGLYQLAYPIYGLLLSISTAGLPTAISKMVAEDMAVGKYKNAHRIFRVSLVVLAIVGFILSGILMASAKQLSVKVLGNPKAYFSVISIAPAIFFVSLMSCFRGFFQGLQDMMPSAISQIVEQIGRVVAVFIFVILLLPKGVEYAAAGAAFGPVVGAIVGLLILIIVFFRKKKDFANQILQDTENQLESPIHIMFRLFVFAIPITLGGLITPIMSLADAAIVNRRLQYAGFSITRATELYGQLSGKAAPLINFPATVTLSLAASLVPAISEALALNNRKLVASRADTAIRISIIFGLPAAIGMFVLAEPITVLLYKNAEAGIPLAVLSWGVIFLSIIQTTTGILQGIGQTLLPVVNLAIGAVAKIILNYTLTSIPSINIKGAALGSVVAYMIPAILNFIAVIRFTGLSIDFSHMFIKPVISTAFMGICVNVFYKKMILIGIGQNKVTLMSIVVGAMTYIIPLILIGGIKKSDLELLPGGQKITNLLTKLGIFGR